MGEGATNILVSGGIRGEVRMFHPARKVCFHEWRPVDKKNIAVNSIVFHSEVKIECDTKLYDTRKYPLCRYILGVLTHTSALD